MVRTARRPRLDWGLRLVLVGALFLAPTVVLGLGLALEVVSGPRLGLAYTVLALGGWASLTIAGMMLKIIPFLVWYRACSPYVGRAPVPTLASSRGRSPGPWRSCCSPSEWPVSPWP
jgi:hypothetical protein